MDAPKKVFKRLNKLYNIKVCTTARSPLESGIQSFGKWILRTLWIYDSHT